MNSKPVTIKDLLGLESFNARMKLANKETNLEKQVTHVTIMEGPDLYEWVTGGEFVLTTWYAFSKNPELQEASFSELAQKVSAVGIKTQRFISKIPESIIALANKYKLPLFEVHHDTKFREVVQIITSEVQNYQTNLLIEVEDHYQRLVKIALDSDNIAILLNEFGRRIRATCLCIDHESKIVATWYDKSKKNAPEDFTDCLAVIKENYLSGFLDVRATSRKGVHIFECYARNSLVGMLVVLKNDELTEKEKVIAQQTACFLAIKLWENYETRKKAINKFWQNLKNDSDITETYIKNALQKFELDTKGTYKVILINKVMDMQKLDNCLMSIANKVISIEEDYLILIATVSKTSSWIDDFETCVKNITDDYILVETDEFKNPLLIKNAYEIALQVINFLKNLKLKGKYLTTDWIGYSLILRSKKSPEYKFIHDNVLLPIINQDKKNKSNLFESLWVALNSESLEQAAGKLSIHLNTLRYRLGKIHELTQKSYFKVSDKYTLLCACIIGKAEENDFLQRLDI